MNKQWLFLLFFSISGMEKPLVTSSSKNGNNLNGCFIKITNKNEEFFEAHFSSNYFLNNEHLWLNREKPSHPDEYHRLTSIYHCVPLELSSQQITKWFESYVEFIGYQFTTDQTLEPYSLIQKTKHLLSLAKLHIAQLQQAKKNPLYDKKYTINKSDLEKIEDKIIEFETSW
ncbi:MAG: hypothetical protein AB7R69_02815 [Candidatus Babeliales bacterium]